MNIERKWSGYWINVGKPMGAPAKEVGAAPYLRKTFECSDKPQQAVAYLCGLGWHELYVNGEKVDDRVLAPVVTQFDRRVSYIAYDIARLLRPGRNAIAVLLGNGWYNCHTPEVWSFDKAHWRDWPKLLCDVVVDGQTVAKSDASWKTADSPITFDALRNGEFYDARLESAGFATPGFDDSTWKPAVQCNPPGGVITQEELEPCRIQAVIPAVSSHVLFSEATVYDFGANLTGWCRIAVRGEAGTRVRIVYAEQVRPVSGDVDREYIDKFVKAGDFQTDEYTLKGGETETWEPHFTYHGFRYAKVSIWGEGKVEKIEACFIHNDFRRVGSFESSDEMLNTLQRNTVRSYLSNFTGIPTDCPHREKNGWTGDAQIAAETGLWNFDAAKACQHFLQLVTDAQRPNGQLSGIAPTGGWGFNWGSGPAWDVVLFEYPWRLYLFGGDAEPIRRHYDHMRKYLGYCAGMSEDYRLRFGLGDWCHHARARIVSVEVTSTACYYYMLTRMVIFANLLGHKAEAAGYAELAEKVRQSFNAAFYRGDGVYADGCMTALGTALYFELADPAERPKVAEKLVQLVRENRHRTDFGILGAKYVPRVLSDYGYADDAHRLLTQTEFPGWGYQVKNGATTLWEHWNGVASQNHIMFGDISAWMFQYPAGVRPLAEAPGFRRFVIEPKFIEALSFVRMSHETPQGVIRSEWRREGGGIVCDFEIPEGASAEIRLPGQTLAGVTGKKRVVLS